MDGLAVFRLPPPLEQAFVRHFGSSRRNSDIIFLTIHCLVSVSYVTLMPSLLSPSLMLALGSSLLPATLYWALPDVQKQCWRTPIMASLKVFMLGFMRETFSKDFDTQSQPWPLFFFKLFFRARVIALLAVGLGLQLPMAVDAPLHLFCVAIMMRSAVPRQCQPGRAPPDMSTLFELNKSKFEAIQGWLDWPFAALENVNGALALSDTALCTAVFAWAQLVLAFWLPVTVLYNSECLARRTFFRGQQRRQGQRGQQQGGRDGEVAATQHSAAAGLGMGAVEGPRALLGQEDRAVSSVWTYFVFTAQVSWCIIRTVVKLSKK